MRAIIIENEVDARELLKTLILNYTSDITIEGEASTVAEGKKIIHANPPDLIFLDVDLDDGTGLDLLEQCKGFHFFVIFTTAYDAYSLDAFKYNTIDYLLKPYGVTELIKSIEKAKTYVSAQNIQTPIEEIVTYLKSEKTRKIPFYTSEGIWMVPEEKIIRLEGEGSYTYLFTTDKKKSLLSKSLGDIMETLPPKRFFRIHKSHAVNKDHINKYVKEDGGYVVVSNGDKIPVARARKDTFVKYLLKD